MLVWAKTTQPSLNVQKVYEELQRESPGTEQTTEDQTLDENRLFLRKETTA